ncbi:hypothetical protein I4U23_006996 [Adineta vaga]|nr:hypothetical protein I4U23_006996 [Adineta vaga]
MTKEFKDFSNELADLKETENYVENDLERLAQMIDDFSADLTQLSRPQKIQLNKEESNRIRWELLIYVQEKSENTERQQTPQTDRSKFMAACMK